jgi:hypothetical protein
MKSLRSLISWSTLLLMAGLLVLSALVYVTSEALLHRFVDGRLLALAEALAELVERHPDVIENSGRDTAPADEVGRRKKELHALPDVTHSLRVFSPDGRLLWNSPNAAAQESIPPHVLQRVRHEHTVFETVESATGTPARHLFLSIEQEGQVRYVLQAETSLLHYRETLNGLVFLLALGSGATLFVAWVGSLWLAKKCWPRSRPYVLAPKRCRKPTLENA